MSIKLAQLRNRKKVGWLREEPPREASEVFREREYSIELSTDEMLEDPAYLAGLSTLVIDRMSVLPDGLKKHAQRILDFDCRVILRIPATGLPVLIKTVNRLGIPIVGISQPYAAELKWQDFQAGEPPAPHALFFLDSVSWPQIANFVSESRPGPAPDPTLKIYAEDGYGKATTLVPEPSAELLIRRAFADCSEVHLTRIVKGRSGVDVYRVCAELKGGVHGQWPQPRFVKLGDRSKILIEYRNYVDHVEPYIPFHLGPHLVRERCCLGGKHGILVGDYVEESEDLCDCAPSGRSASAIACLFDRTLLGWHRSARVEMTPIAHGLLGKFPRKIDSGRMMKAKRLGATLDLSDLQVLFQKCTSIPVLVGPIHGDLHSGNVRVRATDAIIIDFLQHTDYPLVLDAASLEAGLLIEGFANDTRTPKAWLESLRPLYESSPLETRSPRANPKNKSFWFYAAVEQIRRYARQWECGRGQYAAVLALALLKKAVKDPEAPTREANRRAAAYVFAESILTSTFGPEPHLALYE